MLHQRLKLVGLGKKTRSQFFKLFDVTGVGCRGVHDHLDVIQGVIILDKLEAFQTIHLRHVHIQENVVRDALPVRQYLQGGRSTVGDQTGVVRRCFLHCFAEQGAVVRIIIDV